MLGAGACAAQVEQPSEDQPVSQELEASKHHRKSPVKLVITAARDHADLSEEQLLTIDAIDAEFDGECSSFKTMRKELRNSAVAVVRAGTADSVAFDQSVADAVAAIEERVQKNIDALVEIHSILEPEQRAAVADALHTHLDQKFGKKRDRADKPREGFDRFADYMLLSNDQIKQLTAMKDELMGDKRRLRPSPDELYGLVDAFEGEDFAPAVDAFHAEKSRLIQAHVAQAGQRTDTVLSIFTPEQRELLADLILEGPRKVLFGEEDEAID